MWDSQEAPKTPHEEAGRLPKIKNISFGHNVYFTEADGEVRDRKFDYECRVCHRWGDKSQTVPFTSPKVKTPLGTEFGNVKSSQLRRGSFSFP